MTSARVWADYVPVGTVWLLTLVPASTYRRPSAAILLGTCWLFAGLLLPGVIALPTFATFPTALVRRAREPSFSWPSIPW